jgi:glycosyltransferase involved in cell wall biosynthesis
LSRRPDWRPSAPEVSVVVPTHNRKDLLLRTLRSVLGQREVELEVLVVDDGSTDGTERLIRSLSDQRVALIRHEAPRGVAAARNAGAEAARGGWIALLDDDDLWAPDKLARQLFAARGAGADWAYGGAVEIDDAGRLLGGERPPQPERLLQELTRRNLMPAGSSNVIVNVDAFRLTGGFDERLRHLADWDMWLRLSRGGPPACASAPLVAYRLHPSQATLDTRGMIEEARVLRDRHGVGLTSIRRWLAWSHLRRGRRRDAIAAYSLAVASGDLTSIGRAIVAALHPRPTAARRRPSSDQDLAWSSEARPWLAALAQSRDGSSETP